VEGCEMSGGAAQRASIPECPHTTRGTETSQYPEERKATALFLCFYTFGCRFSERKRAERTSVSLFFEHTDSFTLNKLECSRQALADSQVVSFFNSANNTYISADISNNALLIYFVAARFC